LAKIYYITNLKLPTEKAHGYQIAKTCEALAKKGAEVELVMPFRESHIKEDIFDFYEVERVFGTEYLSGFDFRKWEGWLGAVWFWLHKRSFRRKVRKWARDKEGVFYTREDGVANELTKIGKKVFYEAHTWSRKVKRHLGYLRGMAGVITITESLRREYLEAGFSEEKVITAPDGVESKALESKVESHQVRKVKDKLGIVDEKVVMYVGSFQKWKGINCLVEAINELKVIFRQTQDINVKLVLVGSGPEEKNLRLKVDELGLRDEVVFTGFVERNKISELMAAADVLILPNSAQEDISRLYTSPLKMFEYMAAGRPIVASDLPSIREVLSEETVILVEPDNAEALAEGIREVLEDEELAERMAARAREEVKKYTWDKRAEQILKIIFNE